MTIIETLSALTGQPVTRAQLAVALNTSEATVSRRINGRGFDAAELLNIADSFAVPRTILLLQTGLLTYDDVADSLLSEQTFLDSMSDLDLARELVRRLSGETTPLPPTMAGKKPEGTEQ